MSTSVDPSKLKINVSEELVDEDEGNITMSTGRRMSTRQSELNARELNRHRSLSLMHNDYHKLPDIPEAIDDIDMSQVPWLKSQRLKLAILSFLGFVMLYAQRVDLSIAIVAMVSFEHARNNNSDSGGDDSCPDLDHSTMYHEFHWSKKEVGVILGAFFWGYLVLQVIGGSLSEKFGAKKVVFCTQLPVSILTLSTPLAARLSPSVLIFTRALSGVFESVMYPSAQALWANWAPPNERSTLIGFTYAGGQFGNALVFPISGFLCENGFDGGWPTVFYFMGSMGTMWCFLWLWLCHDTPNENKSITEIERRYINLSLGITNDDKPRRQRPPVPWGSILTSMPFYAIMVAHVCGNYGAYMMLTKIPSYMKEVLKFDIKANGMYSMLPYLAFWFTIGLGSIVADALITRGVLSVIHCRKLLAFLGLILPAIALVGVGFMDCHQTFGAVVLLTLSVGLCGLQFCSFFVNHSDIAPRYAGTLFGMTNTMATIPGIVSPYVVSAMTPNGTQGEWQKTFFLAALIYVFGAIWYVSFASSDIQPWAKDPAEMNNNNANTNSAIENGSIPSVSLQENQRRKHE